MWKIWNPKIPENKCTAFKPGQELSTSNPWNNFTQTAAWDMEQNWFLAKIPFKTSLCASVLTRCFDSHEQQI